jgi:AhpD family alkylhydroperoxidase
MKTILVPTKDNVTVNNQTLFDNLEKAIGFVPNMYALMANSPTALGDYLTLQNRKTSLTNKEKEAINLIVSEQNNCDYCRSAHSVIGKMMGFTEEQTLEIRRGFAPFNPKLNALVSLAKSITENKGEVLDETKSDFFEVGYTVENLIDVVFMIGDKIITNYLFALTKVPIDFPIAKKI